MVAAVSRLAPTARQPFSDIRPLCTVLHGSCQKPCSGLATAGAEDEAERAGVAGEVEVGGADTGSETGAFAVGVTAGMAVLCKAVLSVGAFCVVRAVSTLGACCSVLATGACMRVEASVISGGSAVAEMAGSCWEGEGGDCKTVEDSSGCCTGTEDRLPLCSSLCLSISSLFCFLCSLLSGCACERHGTNQGCFKLWSRYVPAGHTISRGDGHKQPGEMRRGGVQREDEQQRERERERQRRERNGTTPVCLSGVCVCVCACVQKDAKVALVLRFA